MTTQDSRNIDRTKVAPFLLRTFIKQQPGHRTSQFDSPDLPTQDEFQIYTWMDATLRELLITLRALSSPSPLLGLGDSSSSAPAPGTAELHHPLAKYIFRALYPDPTSGGRFQSKELGVVYARDLSDPSILEAPFQPFPEPIIVEARMDQDENPAGEESLPGLEIEPKTHENGKDDAMDTTENVQEKPKRSTPEPAKEEAVNDATGREARTLQDLRFHKGDYLAVTIILPKSTGGGGGSGAAGGGPGLSIRGSASGRGGLGRGDPGPARQIPWVTSPTEPNARGSRDVRGDRAMGGNWRGGPGPSPTTGRGGGFGSSKGDLPVNRRDSRADRGGGRGGRRGGPTGRRGRSRSRSKTHSRSRSRSRDRSMASSHSGRRSKSRSRSRSRSPPPRRDS